MGRRTYLRALLIFSSTTILAFGTEARAVEPEMADSLSVSSSRLVTLSGTVIEEETGAPIAAAIVRLPELHRAESTHEDGTFSFSGVPEGTYTLVILRLGYRPFTRRIALSADTTLRITLAPTALQLAQQVITGSITERSAEEALSPTSVLRGADLDRQLQTTVAATLQNQPGVTVSSVGPATGRPVIRGLSGDRILVLEDGQRSGDMSSTSGDHAVSIDPLTATRIEVVRGPMSLLYGSSALGGVVNVVREEVPTSLPEHAHGTLSLEGSSVNRGLGGGVVASGNLGGIAFRGEGSGRRASDTQTPGGPLVNTDSRNVTLSGGGALVRDWGHTGASYRFYDNQYGIPGGFVGAHPEGVDISMRRHSVRGELELHTLGGEAAPLHLSAVFTDYRHDEIEKDGHIGTRFEQELVQGDAVWRHAAAGPFQLGAMGARVQFRDILVSGSLRTPSTRDYSIAGFVVEELALGRLSLQGGVRYDWSRYEPLESTTIFVGGRFVPVRPRTFGSVSGSLGTLLSVADGVRIGGSIARAYRTPDFNELYSDGPHLAANSYDVGDPDLGAESGLGVDVFLRVQRDHVRAEIATFRNQLDNYIFPSSRGRAELGRQAAPRFQYTNENAVLTGAEGRLELSLTRYIVLEGTVSSVFGRFTSDRAPIPEISNGGADTTFVPASRHPPLLPPVRGRVALRHEHPRYFTEAATRLSGRQNRTGDFETPTPAYALVDFSAGYRFLIRNRLHAITLRGDNLLNEEYRDHLSRTKAIMPEPGRNVSLVYRLTF